MQLLLARTKKAVSPLDRQSGQLLGYFDTLFRRLMLPRRSDDHPALDCSREELRALIVMGDGDRVTMSSLAGELGVPLSTATHTIDRLVAKGIAARTRSEEDRRVVQVEMSEVGKKLQESFKEKRRAIARSWLEPLSNGEREIFLELMAKITEHAKPGK